MEKKRKNPFIGMTKHKANQSKAPEDMSNEEIAEEMRLLEKTIGKKRFNDLLRETIGNMVKDNDFDDEDYDDEDDDDNLIDADYVTTLEWSETHPANLVCGSDSYYADLANDLTSLIKTFILPPSAPENLQRELGRVLAAYLEDIVSGTNVFSAMRRICMQKYGYRLPFYDCNHEDYMPDHINEEDIRFLIWKTASQLGREQETIYSPLAPGWELIADKIFDELNSRYEEAPEATRLTDWLRRSFRKEDYIDIREIATWLVFRNPLTYIPGYLNLIVSSKYEALRDEDMDPMIVEQLTYSYIARESWQRSMSPMGCPSRTFVSAMASEFGYDALAKDIEEIKVLPVQLYALSQNKKSRQIFFETSNHEKLVVERESFAKGFKPDLIKYAQCILLKFKGKYLLNGSLQGDPSLKSEWEAQEPYPFFESQRRQAEKWIEYLDGRQVVCASNPQTILKQLRLPEKSVEHFPDAKDYVFLLSRELGISIMPDMGYAFDLPDNRFFRKRQAAKDSFTDLIFKNHLPHDVAMYIQNNHLLPEACIGASQGKETGRRIVQDYMAFWIGFYCELPAYGDTPKSEYYGKTPINH